MKQKSVAQAWTYFNENYITYEHIEIVDKMNSYVDFIFQDLTLADFVPCKDNIPLEKPHKYDVWVTLGCPTVSEDALGLTDEWYNHYVEYQQALDRVVYEGWELRKYSDGKAEIINQDGWIMTIYPYGMENHKFLFQGRSFKTREDMVGFEIRDEVAKKLNLM